MKSHLAIVFFCSGSLALATPGAASPSPSQTPQPTTTPAPTLRESVNGLDLPQIQKALETLQSNFLAPGSFDELSRQRALLEGTIRRLAPGASIVAENDTTPSRPASPLVVEILDDRAGYLRPGALDAANLAQVDTALTSFSEKKLPAVIVDLRAIPAGSEFDMAADFARRFATGGKILFTIQKPSAKQERVLTSEQAPLFTGVVVVLTDSDTSGAAEILAAALRQQAGAMIVGTDTAGEAVEYSVFPIGGGRAIRVAVSQAVLPDGTAIFPNGVKPDVAVSLTPMVQDEIFAASREKGVSQFVFDAERPRMNEAALVANTNPEIEPTTARPDRARPPLRDTVLQRAMDLITAIGFFRKIN